jgi:hypothetical protein
MTSYFEGDSPAQPLVVVPARDGDELELELYDRAVADLIDAAGGVTICAADLLGDDVDDGPAVAVTLPQLLVPGLAVVVVRLTTAGGRTDTADGEDIVVQARNGWHTLDSARTGWVGGRALDDAVLFTLLETSRIECAAYAPKLKPGAAVPLNYRAAQLTHARNRNAAARVDPASGDTGVDSYGIGAFPLDWTVQQQLRPKRRLGIVR